METLIFHKLLKQFKIFGLTGMVLFFISTMVFAFLYIGELKKRAELAYVSTDQGVFVVRKNETGERYIFDIRNHIRFFFQNMFSHDEYSYNKNIEKALPLINKEDGKRIYSDLKKGGVYEMYKKFNARTVINIDSIKVNEKIRPYEVRVYAIQTVFYSESKNSLPIAAKFEVSEVNRSEENPFGLLIKKFEYISYNPQIDGE